MPVQSVKSIVSGVIATIIGGAILIFIYTKFGREKVVEDPVVDNQQVLAGSDQKIFYSDLLSFSNPIIKMYECGAERPPKEERKYTDVFQKKHTRYINWELTLSHQPLEQDVNVSILTTYLYSNGEVFASNNFDQIAKQGWEGSIYTWGWGWNDPGNWPLDTFTVECYIKGNLVAKTKFSIIEIE
jgi:hypothetical protein